MDTDSLAEANDALAIEELTKAFIRLKQHRSSAVATIMALKVALSVFGADGLPSIDPSKPSATPPSSINAIPKLTTSMRKRRRRSQAARARDDAKRAAFLRAKADRLAQNAAPMSDVTPSPEVKASPHSDTSPPRTPPSDQQLASAGQHRFAQTIASSSGLGKRSAADRSPEKQSATRSSAAVLKRASAPPQINS